VCWFDLSSNPSGSETQSSFSTGCPCPAAYLHPCPCPAAWSPKLGLLSRCSLVQTGPELKLKVQKLKLCHHPMGEKACYHLNGEKAYLFGEVWLCGGPLFPAWLSGARLIWMRSVSKITLCQLCNSEQAHPGLTLEFATLRWLKAEGHTPGWPWLGWLKASVQSWTGRGFKPHTAFALVHGLAGGFGLGDAGLSQGCPGNFRAQAASCPLRVALPSPLVRLVTGLAGFHSAMRHAVPSGKPLILVPPLLSGLVGVFAMPNLGPSIPRSPRAPPALAQAWSADTAGPPPSPPAKNSRPLAVASTLGETDADSAALCLGLRTYRVKRMSRFLSGRLHVAGAFRFFSTGLLPGPPPKIFWCKHRVFMHLVRFRCMRLITVLTFRDESAWQIRPRHIPVVLGGDVHPNPGPGMVAWDRTLFQRQKQIIFAKNLP